MRGVVIHGVLALLGLSLAYSTWTREEEVEEVATSGATVLDCTPEAMTRVELETPTNRFVVTPQKRGDDTLYWVVNEVIPPKPKEPPPAQAKAADAGLPEGGPAQADAGVPKPAEPAKPTEPKKPARPTKPTRFLAKASYEDYLKKAAPLQAIRALGVIEESRFEDFGFDEVGTFLRLQCGERKLQLDIGSRTYGSARRYARNPENGEVYLIDKDLVQDLKSARYKFMRTELHDFGLNDADEAIVTAEGVTRKLVHRNRQFTKDAHWVDAAAPDQRNQLFANWFTRIGKLKVRAYLGDGEAPGSDLDPDKGPLGEAYTALTIAYAVDGRSLGQLELAAVPQGEQTFYYAKTEATRNWAAVYASAAKQVAEDVREVVGGEAPTPLASEASAPAAAPSAPAAAPSAPAPSAPAPGVQLPAGHPRPAPSPQPAGN